MKKRIALLCRALRAAACRYRPCDGVPRCDAALPWGASGADSRGCRRYGGRWAG